MPLLSKKGKKSVDKPNTKVSPNVVINIFGTNLDYGSSFGLVLDGFNVPIIVRDCISYIEKNGIDNEGIYRVSGASSRIEELKQKYNCLYTDRSILYDNNVTPNDVAALFKLYLRRLSEPILSKNESSAMEKLILDGGSNISLIQLEKLLFQLCESHYFTLGYICCHLKKVIHYSESNKMTNVNIAIVFSPTLSFNPKVLLTLVEHSDILFPDCKTNSPPSDTNKRRNEILDYEERQIYLASELRNKNMTLSILHNMLGQLKDSPEFCVISDVRIKVQKSLTSISRELKHHNPPASMPELEKHRPIKAYSKQSNEYDESNINSNKYHKPTNGSDNPDSETVNKGNKPGSIQKSYSILKDFPNFDVYISPSESTNIVEEKRNSHHSLDEDKVFT